VQRSQKDFFCALGEENYGDVFMGDVLNIRKRDIIEHILKIEWEMFRSVKTRVPAECQQDFNSFREIRASIFETWTEEMLNSYIADLLKAKETGKNPFVEKYAKMDGLLPLSRSNPLIDRIVDIEEKWQKEIEEKYPFLYHRVCRNVSETPDGRSFSYYLRSELETYGDNTLRLYYQHIVDAFEKGENLAIKSLELLIKKSGFSSLEQAEAILKN